eukprot:CAMPEP_0119432402 /NCGR_PEP_ID=MMETSP1335-20130426/47745_1 /TAXON_ID=259385 /ORGANISM="Chrysoculter rhomboideus, Strain RCC1486" /LENGTH=61 /DNA_ID=CAMNT_0007458225 /DNA_START=79 /DNA_END=261 /DNA_ORIENTATION=+
MARATGEEDALTPRCAGLRTRKRRARLAPGRYRARGERAAAHELRQAAADLDRRDGAKVRH